MSMRTEARAVAPQSSVAPTFTLLNVPTDSAVGGSADAALTWNDLTPTERSAASLGVDPNAWKPIGFLNTAHYDTLLKTNAIDEELAKKLEAFKKVSSGGS